MILKFHTSPWKTIRHLFLCYFKLCVSFYSHVWIQTDVTVQKCLTWVKISNFLSHVTLIFDRWPWKTVGHLFCATLSYVHHFIAICKFKLELQFRNAQIGATFVLTSDFDLWPLTLAFCMDITFVNGNNSWKFRDDTMRVTLWKKCQISMDRQTEVFLELLGHS